MVPFERFTTAADGGVVARRLSAILASVDLTALLAGLIALGENAYHQAVPGELLPQDIWQPFAVFIWFLALANGGLLATWPRTRQVGFGMLIGTLVTAPLTVLLFAILLTAMGS
jgi:hypothetical protein